MQHLVDEIRHVAHCDFGAFVGVTFILDVIEQVSLEIAQGDANINGSEMHANQSAKVLPQRKERRAPTPSGMAVSGFADKAGSEKTVSDSRDKERTCTRAFGNLRTGDGPVSANKLQDFERTKMRKSNFRHGD